jgi:hypothetical protein
MTGGLTYMHVYKKFLSLFFFIYLASSLIGCSLNADSSQSTVKEVTKVEQETIDKETPETLSPVTNSIEEKEVKPESSSSEKETIVVDKVVTETKNENISTSDKKNSSTDSEKSNSTDKKATTKPNNEKPKETNNKTTTETKPPAKPPVSTISITIIGPKEIGVILSKTKIDYSEGDTVFDVLLKASKKEGFFVEYTGSGAMSYIEGIDNIYEFDYGPKSGWNFKLNGTTVSKSADIVKVKKDDQIEWVYLEDFTEDKE